MSRIRYIDAPQPIEERVDKAGIRQRTDPEGARARRAQGRRDAKEGAPGWWWFDGEHWYFYGADSPPEDV